MLARQSVLAVARQSSARAPIAARPFTSWFRRQEGEYSGNFPQTTYGAIYLSNVTKSSANAGVLIAKAAPAKIDPKPGESTQAIKPLSGFEIPKLLLHTVHLD
jgi:hypothetical protein